ncbi:MAG: protein translocase subunit SecD [Armatimonadota bacterium]|nr:protein translocase subunit SecD [Armatimonadota bacterium]MDR7400793.1 protein translocase subunit SecD [Armatimonadota bacterium]MDR7403870.1 protein translocase subunit SecD [Armatimonadota bacterium]MDR7436613.1 protein translocase subunit SecD [Armatimonadota bacterium]MDR7472968.1 protein translocase subunit SecD [Armatimonadota bacterium]
MRSRLWLRWLFVGALALAACQVAFQPVRLVRWTPQWQPPRLRVTLGLDLQGGSYLVLEAQDTPRTPATPEAVDAVMSVIANRIDQLGVVEPTVQRQGARRIIVELPGIQDPERAIELIGKTALLEFVDTGTTQLPEGARWSADGKTVTLPAPGAQPLALEKKVILTGADLADAQAGFDQTTGEPIVNFQFKGQGAKTFEEFTAAHIGQFLTIVLDNEVISSPVIRDRITGGRGQISGGFRDLTEARDLAVLLRGGALPLPVEVVERRSVGPTLGRDSLERSLRAGAVALAMVSTFMVLLYRLPGLLATVALGLYGLLLLAALVALGATLTLPGIAGFILSVGMAIDANVLIYERVKEELRAGKSVGSAIASGWSRALSAILDSNVTTLLGGAVLFLLGTGPIKGFAVTLVLGVAISMLTAVVITRVFVDSAAGVLRAPRLGFGR